MNPQQFKQLRTLYELVCDLPSHEQALRLREASNDEDLISHVLMMTGRDSLGQTNIAGPISTMFSDAVAPELDVGATLGNWRLTKLIGRGGMGGVFLAERNDGHFTQLAALKILRGIPTANAAALIAQERQVLAGLEHPNIARLLDGGATPGGRPYLVMEYVDGATLDESSLCTKSLPALLQICLTICDAVAFAHRRLVVHCDLKPANILLNREGQVKLLDFGIARLIDTDNNNPNEKRVNAKAFTPRYASPEQKAGYAITTATDIYSLGEIIRELLVAHFSKHQRKWFSVFNAALLPAELNAIVQCAMAHDVADRYVTVEAMAADIRRYLAGEAVRAHPQTVAYLGVTFIRRRWPWLVAASIVSVLLSVSAWRVLLERDSALSAQTEARQERAQAISARDVAVAARTEADAARVTAALERDRATVSARDATLARQLAEVKQRLALLAEARATSARDDATSAAASAKKVNQFLVSIFDGVNPARTGGNRDASAREVVALAEKKLGDLKDVSARDRADVFLALAAVHNSLGANADLQRYYVRAAAALAEIGDAAIAERATILFNLTIARSLALEGDALTPAREAVAITERKFGQASTQFVRALMGLAVAYKFHVMPTEERATRDRLKNIIESLPPSIEANNLYTNYWHALGSDAYTQSNYIEAESIYRRLVARLAANTDPENVDTTTYFTAQLGLARSLSALSRYEDAEVIFLKLYNACIKKNGEASQQCLNINAAFSRSLTVQRKFAEAIILNATRLNIVAKQEGKSSLIYVAALGDSGNTLRRAGGENLQKAEVMLSEAFAIAKRVEKNSTYSQNFQGTLLLSFLNAQNRYEEGLVVALELLEIHQRFAKNDLVTDGVARAQMQVAQSYQQLNQHAKANALLNNIAPSIDKFSPITRLQFYDALLIRLAHEGALLETQLSAGKRGLSAAVTAYGENSPTAKRYRTTLDRLEGELKLMR